MNKRKERIQEQILREVTHVVRREIADPNLGFVTFFKVSLTNDIRIATVFYSVLGDEDKKKESDLIIRNSAKYIKKIVNDVLSLRYAVDLRFRREEVIENDFRIQTVLEKIHEEESRKQAEETQGNQGGAEKP